MYVPVNQSPPSPEAQDLSERLEHIVEDYRAGHPNLSSEDINQAFTLARAKLKPGRCLANTQLRLIIAGLTVLAGVGAMVFFLLARGGGPGLGDPRSFPVVGVAVAILAIGAVAVALGKATQSADVSSMDPKPVVAVVIGLLVLAAGFALFLLRAAPQPPLG